jgi:hypothetical protein
MIKPAPVARFIIPHSDQRLREEWERLESAKCGPIKERE